MLLTHGHFLDPHARLSGGVGGKLLTRTLWAVAAGGREDPRTVADYDAIVGFLTELLYSISQLPHPRLVQLLADLNPLNDPDRAGSPLRQL